MGGIGSGRKWHWDAKSTTSDYRKLDVRRWVRDGLLLPNSTFGWQWSQEDEIVGSVRVAVKRDSVRLIYRSREYGTDWRDWDYRVWLDRTPCHLGGERVWFICPAQGCGRRVAKLYGGSVFACRQCHHLVYPSQREHASDRAARRCERLRAQLGWGGGIFDLPGTKPKGMHRKTFDRLSREVDQAASEALGLAAQRFGDTPLFREMMCDLIKP